MPQVARQVDIPILHIGDATGMAIQKAGLKKVGLIGTRFTMEDGFMAAWLKEHYGIETLVPVAAPARQELHRIIQKELDVGIFKPESKKYVIDQIEQTPETGSTGHRSRMHRIPFDHQAGRRFDTGIQYYTSAFADGCGLHPGKARPSSRSEHSIKGDSQNISLSRTGRTLRLVLLADDGQGLSRWRGGRFACTSLIRRWSLERPTVARYDGCEHG
jgi:hypothetical protein